MSQIKVSIEVQGTKTDITVPFPISEELEPKTESNSIVLKQGEDFNSASISTIYYDPLSKTLGIEFTNQGVLYLYRAVPLSAFIELTQNDSKYAGFLNLRNTYGEYFAKVPLQQFIEEIG